MSEETVWPPAFKTLSSSACSGRLIGSHKTYDVGPGKQYTEMTDVPWLSLTAGDVVNVHYRATPYRTKVGLRAQGTAANPVYINGVTDASCNRPIVSGENAVPAADAKAANFGADIQNLGVFTIYRLPADDRWTYTPKFITIQNLKIAQAKYTYTSTNYAGSKVAYDTGAAGIYAVRAAHLTIENCEITENGNGVFTNTRGGSTSDYSSYIIVRRNRIYNNGNDYRSTEHNLYIQAYRSLYEGNFLGQAHGGSTVKDRSSATVIRFNKILASARALDLVETEEENFQYVQKDPLYNYAWVYGNVIINDYFAPLGISGRPIHWGLDNTTARARIGTLFFYGNTYIHRSSVSNYYQMAVFQVGGNDDNVPNDNMAVEASGNIFWNDDGTTAWNFLANNRNGKVKLRGTNYVPTNWNGEPTSYLQTLVNGVWTTTSTKRVDTTGATSISGNLPKIAASTFVPVAGSPVLNKGITGPSITPAGATAANLLVQGQFVEPMGVVARPVNGAQDLGAFEGQ